MRRPWVPPGVHTRHHPDPDPDPERPPSSLMTCQPPRYPPRSMAWASTTSTPELLKFTASKGIALALLLYVHQSDNHVLPAFASRCCKTYALA
jgi:hypothetical protein